MNLIVPYNEILKNSDAFLSPKNNLIIINNLFHNIFAKDFCCGIENRFINGLPKTDDWLDYINSNSLTKNELYLLKSWLKQPNLDPNQLYCDFLTLVLGYDKFQTFGFTSIVTTHPQPHIKYYNYYLMDWNIDHQKRLKFNNTSNFYEPDNKDELLMVSYQDNKVKNKINEIKQKIKKEDRHYFFK